MVTPDRIGSIGVIAASDQGEKQMVRFLPFSVVFFGAAGLFLPLNGEASTPPNIVLIMLDDMGWSDLGCYGGEVDTPNIDRLAAAGLRFRAFYNAGRCCPTRAALMTGVYPHQAGVGRMTFDRGLPGYRGQLQRNVVTIAEVLRAAGYRTGMVGKWHLSQTTMLPDHMKHLNNQIIRRTFAPLDSYPVNRGFEMHYGVIWGVVNYYDPFSLVHNTEAVETVPDDYYVTDAFTEYAIRFLDTLAAGDAPFFLYLAHCAPHWPLHCPTPDRDRNVPVYRAGWTAVRDARYRRQIQSGLLDPEVFPLSPAVFSPQEWSDNPDAKWYAHAMACHAGMIERVDAGIGRIVDRLRELGELENTLIMVLSDNGASPEIPARPGFDRVSETRDGRPIRYFGPGQPKDVMPGPETTYASIGPNWANVSNTPFRGFKATQYEGGIRTPFIVHWPAGLRTPPGSITDEPAHVIDIMATCIDLAEASYPTEWNGNRIVPLEGKSLLPVFRNDPYEGHEALYFEHFRARAIRTRKWKLVATPRGAWELYDMERDQTETRNLAAEHPDVVRELSARWEEWARRANVYPMP